MKFIKWKTLIISCLICLSPIILGIVLYENIPENMAVHFNFYNEPDNFVSKGFAVFGIPLLMTFIQIFCCIINDIKVYKHIKYLKFEHIPKWIIPITSIILQTAILGYGLGWNIDMRKVAALIVGAIFLVLGIYIPKLDRIKNFSVDAEKALKINKFIGYEMVIMGILMLITIFLPPITTVIWLFLLIPYTIISVIYGTKVNRNKE